ncbi:MAG: class I SAM-dependent methyltransferase [Oscillatoria sp. SIO1A7]|nr:class I SAM-dependent methyltransferase [Oscillatoria sp. SIO1A7]
MSDSKTKEKQYQFMVDMLEEKGPVTMTCRPTVMWRQDPKLLGFTLARHKFVAKMLTGYSRVLEVGCGDAFASRLLHPEVKELHAIDFDPVFIEEGIKHKDPDWPVTLAVHDILTGPYLSDGDLFDAAFSLDVIEHIPPEREHTYLKNICLSLKPGGVFICGCPSLESQVYASPASKEGHINCKSGNDLKKLLSQYFDHTFLFGMNDEVLHTGFSPMCHYLFVLAVGNKNI